jgi:cytochrome-b5 reductase
MLAAGTGLTPMYQIIQAVEDDPLDTTGLSLLTFNQSPTDSILDEDLLRCDEKGILNYFPVVENPDEMWLHGEGRLTKEMVQSFMPPPEIEDSHILVCGSKAMVTLAIQNLKDLGYQYNTF